MSLVRLPLAPEMLPAVVPAETVSAVVPSAMAPPFRVAIVDVAPLRLSVPPETVPRVATPPTETVPPLMSEASVPITLTVPVEMPPVTTALLPKRVEPAPPSEARVIVPVAPVKLRLFAVASALVTPASDRSVPEMVAAPAAPTESVAAAL